MSKVYNIALAGNPNCGKTTLFNGLTGGKQKIGNWPGVTVEKKEGTFKSDNINFNIVDLPGIYSLSAYSEDEKIARKYILSDKADMVINIIDATNLERNLYLTTHLLEMKVPVVVALNMMDLVENKKMKIDVSHLQKHLGCPVIPITAVTKEGIEDLKKACEKIAREGEISLTQIIYANEIEDEITKLIPKLSSAAKKTGVDQRWIAIKLLENDEWVINKSISLSDISKEEILSAQKQIKHILKEETDILFADYRYGFIHGLVKDVVKRAVEKRSVTDMIDKIVLNRVLGIPIFLFIMYIIFWVTINLGGAFIDFFDIFFGTIFVDGFSVFLNNLASPSWLRALLAGGVGGGIQTIATFVPIIFMLFFMLSLLEDSGYMARAAFVMDRFMRFIGLPGKSFVPMLVGFGCTVPAIMATRTLENKRDRLLTIFMTPFMSCGARVPVYALFAAAFFPRAGQNIVFSLYMAGIILAVLTGLLLKRTLFKGEPTPFVMELPPYHTPRLHHILIHTWNRLKGFILKAGKFLILIIVILSFFNSMGIDGTFDNEDTQNSILATIGKKITPVFHSIGLTENNWPATVAIFTGLFAKEAVVGTLNALYSQIDMSEDKKNQSGEEEEKFELGKGIKEAFSTIPENLKGLKDTLSDPLGINIGDVSDKESVMEEMEVESRAFGAMQKRFTGGGLQAYAYLLFILLYFPCLVAMATALREMGWKLTVLLGIYLTILAWIIATLFYQITLAHQIVWIIIAFGFISIIVGFLYWAGKKEIFSK